MTHSIGLAGAGTPHLPVQEGRPILYDHGPFAARLTPTMLQRQLVDAPPDLWFALFTRAPNLDGCDYEEPGASGYTRQWVKITPFNREFDANLTGVAIQLSGGVAAKGVGLFDAEDRLRFYGFCSGHRRMHGLPTVFDFAPFEVKVRKV